MSNAPEKKPVEDLMSTPLCMAELVQVQPDAVVSRTVITKKAGTVTLFAFDQGQGLSTHSAPYDAMVWILEGSAEITIEEKVMQAKTGEMVIMPANKPHGLQANEPFKMALVMIKEK